MIKSLSRGFSLLEVLVAFTILALALLGIASVFPTGHAFIKHSGNIVKASFIAQSVLEEYRKKDFNQVVDSSGSITISDTFNDNTAPVTYTYNVRVNTLAPNYKSINVQVSWQGSLGNRSIILYSTIYNKL
jgi:uncharacterized protein (TIGR02598 family)